MEEAKAWAEEGLQEGATGAHASANKENRAPRPAEHVLVDGVDTADPLLAIAERSRRWQAVWKADRAAVARNAASLWRCSPRGVGGR